ncbi:hypothetical protein E2562_021234 [Oryza meyeriana var. granulata]|uniref:Uncharacterized protein n=1 Tax=Oryza meyeriana var. granulata TaxID=110450 RepID=A0A6G1DZG2_9ORYZ|nr:hypothetical protein E2562_021234 [Oryza meyeriana var. granulata]
MVRFDDAGSEIGSLRRCAPPPRLLLAVYHPRNRYVLHLSADASDAERRDLAAWVTAATPVVGAFQNVAVVGAPTAGTPIGSSSLVGTLRAAAVLLRLYLSVNAERRDLAAWVAATTPAVGVFRNVAVVGAPTAGTPVSSSGLAGTLRAAAVLLRLHLSADVERRDLAASPLSVVKGRRQEDWIQRRGYDGAGTVAATAA